MVSMIVVLLLFFGCLYCRVSKRKTEGKIGCIPPTIGCISCKPLVEKVDFNLFPSFFVFSIAFSIILCYTSLELPPGRRCYCIRYTSLGLRRCVCGCLFFWRYRYETCKIHFILFFYSRSFSVGIFHSPDFIFLFLL